MGYVPDRGDLVWLTFSIGKPTGHEPMGRRPALVLSHAVYNSRTGMFIVCQVTSHEKGYAFEVALPPGGRLMGVVLADQPWSLDWRERQAEFADRAPTALVNQVTTLIHRLIDE